MTFGSQVLQYVLTGLTIGSIYALVAVGFVVIHAVTGILNLAQGEFAMIGAMAASGLWQGGMALPLAVGISILIAGAAGATVERLTVQRARRATPLTMVIVTIGTAIGLRGLGLLVWGTDPRGLPPFIPGAALHLLGATIQRQGILVFAASVLLVWGLHHFFNRTVTGMAVRALVLNRRAARLVGIAPQKMSLLAFTVSAALGGVAGVLVTPIATATYDMGLMLSLKAFVAALLGGLSNAPAAVAGGFLLGVSEAMAAGLVSSAFKDAIAFAILLLLLFLRPAGLFGRASVHRV